MAADVAISLELFSLLYPRRNVCSSVSLSLNKKVVSLRVLYQVSRLILPEDYVHRQVPDEDWRTQQPKSCDDNNEDQDISTHVSNVTKAWIFF